MNFICTYDVIHSYIPPTLFRPCPRLNYLNLQTNNYSKLDTQFKDIQLKSGYIRTGLRGK